MELPRPLGTPSSRGRMSDISNFQEFIFLLLKRRWIQKLVFEDGGVPKHQQNKNLQDTNILKSICNIFLLYWRGGGFEKRSFLKTEEFSSHRMLFCSTIDFRTPSELFSWKKFSSLFKRDSVFSMFKEISERYKSKRCVDPKINGCQ